MRYLKDNPEGNPATVFVIAVIIMLAVLFSLSLYSYFNP